MIHPWLQLAFYVPSIVGMLLLIAFVLVNNPHNYLSRVFSALSAAGLLYITVALIANLNSNLHHAALWMRLADGFASTIPGFLYWLVWIFPERRKIELRNWFLLPTSLFFVASVWLPGYLNALRLTPYGYVEVPGPLGWAFQAYVFGLATIALVILVRKRSRVDVSYRNQIRFMAYGVGSVLVLNLLFNFSGLPLHLDRYSLFFAVPSYLLLIGSIGYGMVRHHLFDVRPLVARSLAYSLLLATLGGLYGAAIFGVSRLFFLTTQVTTVQQVIYTVLAILLAFTFQPLRRFFEHATDRFFFHDTYNTEEVLHQLGETLSSEIILSRLLKRSLYQICRSLRLSSGQFVILHGGQIHHLASYGHVIIKPLTMEELQALNEPIISVDNLDDSHRRQLLTERKLRVSVLLRTKEQFVGFLLLGDKLSGDIYSNQDLEFLQLLSSQLAVAVANAISYEQVSQFNETLKDRINRATGRLRVANQHLKELDEAKDEFISMASHQLRTPLTTIKGYVSMMLDGTSEPLKPKQRQFAEMAFESTERMVSLVSDLLNVSRLESGRFVIEATPTDLVALTRNEVKLLAQHAVDKGLKLEVVAAPRLPKITLDPGKTSQVIMNFIDNAIYYTKKGSITVNLAKGSNGGLRLAVTDTGIGVPKEATDQLFTKFFRSENAKAVRPDGTGLGLFLAKRVVEAQGGQIIFTSREGQGSTFGFELPLSPPATTQTKLKHPAIVHS